MRAFEESLRRRRATGPGAARAQARRSSERGAAAVEFAIVSVFLFTLVFGIITFGFIFALDNSITHLAAESARAAVSKPTAAEQIDHAKKTAYGRMPGWIRNKMDPDGDGTVNPPAALTADINGCTNAPTQNCIRVHIAYSWATNPVIHPMPGFGLVAPDLITADAVVQVD